MKRMSGRAAAAVATVLAVGLVAAPGASAKGFAYIAGGSQAEGFTIGADGSLTPAVPPVATGLAAIRGSAISPDAKHLFIVDFGGKVASFNIGADGALTEASGSPFTIPNNAFGVAAHGSRVYTSSEDGGNGKLAAFDLAPDGNLTEIPGSPFALGYQVQGIAVNPDGTRLYAIDATANTVHAYDISAGGATEVGTAQVTGANPKSVVVSPQGDFVFTTGGQSIRTFPVNPDGSLQPSIANLASGLDLVTAALTPDARFIYAAGFNTPGGIAAYAVAADGQLSFAPGHPVAAPDFVEAVDASPGGMLYSASFDVAASPYNSFAIGADGALTPVTNASATTISQAEFQAVTVTPNQGPVAALKAKKKGAKVTFDASGSSDPDGGTVASYQWDFGDGKTATSTSPKQSHTYKKKGKFTATVTVTDDEGCSTTLVYTGQTADCAGSAAATASVKVNAKGGLKLKLSGKKTQKLGSKIALRAKCSAKCKVKATGSLFAGGQKFKVKGKTKLKAGKKGKLSLKVPAVARRVAASALRRGGKVTVKVKATAKGGGAKAKAKRTVRLTG